MLLFCYFDTNIVTLNKKSIIMQVERASKSEVLILKVAKNLFWKHGIRRVTVEEICKEAKVSKMTFYRNFKNKQELVEILIEKLSNESIEDYRRIMSEDVDYDVKIKKLIKLKYVNVVGISKEFVKDLYQDEKLQKKMSQLREGFLKEIMEDFQKAQKEGWIRQDLKLEFIFYMLNDLNAKMMDEQLQAIYDSEEELIMDLTQYFFYGILTPKEMK